MTTTCWLTSWRSFDYVVLVLEGLLYLEDLDYGALGLDLLVYIGLMTLEDLDYGALALD